MAVARFLRDILSFFTLGLVQHSVAYVQTHDAYLSLSLYIYIYIYMHRYTLHTLMATPCACETWVKPLGPAERRKHAAARTLSRLACQGSFVASSDCASAHFSLYRCTGLES